LDNAGDVVMVGPALRALKAAWPAARLTLLASPAGGSAARLLPWVDDVMTWRASWQDASSALPLDPEREQALMCALRERAFDAAFIFTSFSQSVWPPAYACYIAGIPERVGQARDFGGSLLTHRVAPLPDCVHQVERNLHLVEAVGVPVARRELEIRIGEAEQEAAGGLLRQVGISPADPFVLVAPGASCAARRYEPDRYGAVLARLARRTDLPLVLVGHPREAAAIERIKAVSRTRRAVTLARDTSFAELAALVGRARLLVANNSGPMHIADALRCPMVILYSGSELEEQWQPRNAPARLLRRPTPCEPCYRFECPYQMQCLDIPPAEVVEACEEMLARTAHRLRVAALPPAALRRPTARATAAHEAGGLES
jgi:ADP-heptose:LPS heptosyltransferase